MEPTGASKDRLLGSEPSVEPVDHFRVEADVVVRQRRRRLVDRLDGADATEAAAGGSEKIALPAPVNAGRRWGQLDLDDVLQVRMLAVGQHPDCGHIAAGPNDPFTEEEAQRQLALVTRRPHHDGQRRPAYSNFERLLRGELILDPGTGLLTISQDPRPVRAA